MIAVAVLAIASCTPGQVENDNSATPTGFGGNIVIYGEERLLALARNWADAFSDGKPSLKFEIVGEFPDKSIESLLSGTSDLAMVSGCNASLLNQNGLCYVAVSKEAIIPIVSKNNPYLDELLARGINRETLAALFALPTPISWGNLLNTEYKEPVMLIMGQSPNGTTTHYETNTALGQSGKQGLENLGVADRVGLLKNEPFGLSFCNAHNIYNLDKN